ncbi:MAG: hypothetical protein JWL69_3451 [Phycisphaerales bacterium]|nr:hypothetical protein [Phycisphaerales bacterium]
MSLKRKGSRLIRVGGESYRWTISGSRQAETASISIIIEAAHKPGQRLVVRVPCRDFWLDFKDLTENRMPFSDDVYRPVTPATVHKIILAALAAGWQPQRRGKNLACEWAEDGILVRLDRKQEAS